MPGSAQMIDQSKLKLTPIPTSPHGSMWKNPYWDQETSRLFAADLFGNLVLCYSFADEQVHLVELDDTVSVGIFMPVAGTSDQYLVNAENRAYVIEWDGRSQSVRKGATVFQLGPDSKIDSIFVGPNGNMYVGDFGPQNCLETARFGVYGYNAIEHLLQYADDFYTSGGGVVVPDHGVYYLGRMRKAIARIRMGSVDGRFV